MNVTEEAARELLVILKDSKAFVLEQAPEVAREIITWGKESNLWGLLIGVLFCLAALVAYKLGRAKSEEWGDGAICLVISSIFLAVWGVVMTLSSAMDYRKICVAPKLYIIEQLNQNASK